MHKRTARLHSPHLFSLGSRHPDHADFAPQGRGPSPWHHERMSMRRSGSESIAAALSYTHWGALPRRMCVLLLTSMRVAQSLHSVCLRGRGPCPLWPAAKAGAARDTVLTAYRHSCCISAPWRPVDTTRFLRSLCSSPRCLVSAAGAPRELNFLHPIKNCGAAWCSMQHGGLTILSSSPTARMLP